MQTVAKSMMVIHMRTPRKRRSSLHGNVIFRQCGVALAAAIAVTTTPADATQDNATGEYFLIQSPDLCSNF